MSQIENMTISFNIPRPLNKFSLPLANHCAPTCGSLKQDATFAGVHTDLPDLHLALQTTFDRIIFPRRSASTG